MRLKKLELHGFKSFADRTEIFFDEGVTCVVGPNGCGKSNISDSIRWVLGERSAKLLRGSKMEDVIFNGTDYRKPVAMAEVSLTIDNTDRGLPIDYQEVTITRRLHRSGESEYLINRTSCRLKDIQDLILDTGIGSNSYSMIEQGRIDYILNADPEERRFLIEEAAGISKFKVKKEEAIRKLERTEENLLRLKDIIHEVQKNIQYAERQARRAERYKEQLQKLKDLEIRKAFYDLSRLKDDREALEQEKTGRQSKLTNFESQLAEGNRKQEIAAASLREILGRYSQEESRRYDVRSRMEQNDQQLRFHQEKRVELAQRGGQIQQEKSELGERLERNKKELSGKEADVAQLEIQKAKASNSLKSEEDAFRDIETKLEAAKALLDQNKSQLFQAAADTTKVRNEYHRLLAILESSDDRKVRQQAGASRFQKELTEWETKKQNCEKDIVALQEKITHLEIEKESSEQKLKAFEAELSVCAGTISKIERDLHEKETRLRLLSEIDSQAGITQERLLADTEELERAFIKTTRQVFKVREGYEWALETALGSYARALVADNIRSAEKMLGRILDKRPSGMGLLIRETAKPNGRTDPARKKPAHRDIRYAVADVVTIEPGYEDLFAPFFHNVFILEDLTSDNLKELLPLAEENKLITREGVELGPEGRLFFHPDAQLAELGFFKRSAELESLQQESGKLKAALAAGRNQVDAIRESMETLTKDFEELESQLIDARIQRESYQQLRRGMEERLISLRRELQLIHYESEELLSGEEEAVVQKNRHEGELARLEEKERGLRHDQESLVRNREALDQKKEQAFKEFAQAKARAESLDERSHLLEDSLSLLVEQERRDRKRIEQLRDEASQMSLKEKNLAEEDEKLKAEQTELAEKLHGLDVNLEVMRREKEKAEIETTQTQNSLQEIRQSLQRIREQTHQLDMKLMDLGFKEKTIADRFQQTYQITLSELKAEDYSLGSQTAEEIETVVTELRGKMDSLGTVNLLAIEEYEELRQRYDFLIAQQTDLENAREELLEAIRKINRTTKTLFEETFANVQKTFQEYYATLFRGGEARLVLVDETNPLESGIDIIVRPPGKKLQHITLLSGGEKAMTAIALLFALFKIKPSPFCVLDEVDAPLDEANIDRFLTVLRTFLESSQFIITTHNRKTIGMGDSLYGVTMGEAGVSKIVSVKVNADGPAPAELDSGRQKQVENQVTA